MPRLFTAARALRPSSCALRPLKPHTRPPTRRSIVTTSLAPGGAPSPTDPPPEPFDGEHRDEHAKAGGGAGASKPPKPPRSAMMDSALSTVVGITLLAGAGIAYHHWYKFEVLRKMRRAFGEGYDPVLELVNASRVEHPGRRKLGKVRRKEQEFVNQVVNGEIVGEYVLLLGPKGVGKTTLLVEAMLANDADGVAMVEAHEDPEVFRLRLGKALDFEYSEDSFAGLFQRRDPREAGPMLDMERALNKLEKVAIKYRKEKGRPLCLIFNNIHFVHDDEEGHALLHMLQQRAESWAQAGVLTTVFNSDDFAPYRHLKKNASRMRVLSIRDLSPSETHICLAASHPGLDPMVSFAVWDLIGGRLSWLSKLVGKDRAELVETAQDMVDQERAWLEGRLGLIPDHDDDVMDSQLLFQEFARLAASGAAQAEAAYAQLALKALSRHPTVGVETILDDDDAEDMRVPDPKVGYGRAREIMTRPDYISDLDHHNIINVDANHVIRPDSRLMLSVFRQICEEDGFQERLDNVCDRINEIESLHRTAELTVKKDHDLGGVLRLRLGALRKEAEAEEQETDEDGHLV